MFIQLLCFTQCAFGTLQGLIKVWHLAADAAETHHHVSLPGDADAPEFAVPPRLKYSPMASLLAKSQRNCERPTYSCTECPRWRNATARALAWLHCLSSQERIHAPDYWRRGPLPIRIWRTNNWGRRTFLYARVSHKTVYFRGGNNGQCVQHNLLQEPHYEAI